MRELVYTRDYMNNFEDILTQILDVVGKTDGKKQFIVDFVTIVNMEAMARLIESLPKADQEKVVDLFISLPDGPGKEAAIFGPYFTRERRREVLLDTMRATTKKFVSEHPDLSSSQRKKCLSLLDRLTC
jgi:hypothetical protein